MNRRQRRRALIVGLVLFVVVSGTAAAIVESIRTRTDIDRWTAEKSEVVESVVQDVLDGVFADVEAMAGYVEQADPSLENFAAFVDRINGAANSIGVGYVAVIPADSIDQHVAERRAALGEFYDIFGLAPDTGLPIPIDKTGRDEFFPVQLFAFGALIEPLIGEDIPVAQLGLGVDGGYLPSWQREIGEAIAANGRNLSSFITLEAQNYRFDRVFFASVPVAPQDGRPPGIVVSVMFEPLLLQDLDKRALDDVQWEVIPIGGKPERIESAETRFFELNNDDIPWELAVAPTDEALTSLTGRGPWVAGIATGLMAAAGAALVWLLIERRKERIHASRLQAAAAEKDRFLATVSHELRTPLTVVAGVASEIRDRPDGFDSDELVSLHSMIVEETDELTAIVEDLLVAARSDITSVAVSQQPVELAAEAENAIRTSGAQATVTGEPVQALADPQRVRQVLRNLLTNAVRYGGSQVSVTVSANTDTVDVVVADSGNGIPPEKRRLVFEPYQSAHDPGTQTGSVGLGLYVSRSLARAMGGDLTYSHDGGWSRFRLHLPSAECAISDRPAAGAEPQDELTVRSGL